jgi:F0F1-type ATP synthase assembly protein I
MYTIHGAILGLSFGTKADQLARTRPWNLMGIAPITLSM